MIRLRTDVRPMIAANMTTTELLREAHHAFPHPTPIIAAMLERLSKTHGELHEALASVPSCQPGGLQCPACGAQLQLET